MTKKIYEMVKEKVYLIFNKGEEEKKPTEEMKARKEKVKMKLFKDKTNDPVQEIMDFISKEQGKAWNELVRLQNVTKDIKVGEAKGAGVAKEALLYKETVSQMDETTGRLKALQIVRLFASGEINGKGEDKR